MRCCASLVMLLPAERDELSLLIADRRSPDRSRRRIGRARRQTDIRRLLGYVVISGIGNMLVGVALGTPDGLGGAVFYALYSVVLMTALYLRAGEVWQAEVLLPRLPRSQAFIARTAGLPRFRSCCSWPPAACRLFSGFWPKVLLVKASLDVDALVAGLARSCSDTSC